MRFLAALASVLLLGASAPQSSSIQTGVDVGVWPGVSTGVKFSGEPALPESAWSMPQADPQWPAPGLNWAQKFTYNTDSMTAVFAADITDQPVPLILSSGLGSDADADCGEVQVWTAVGFSQVQLDFEIEAGSDCESGPAVLWIEMPTVEEGVADTDWEFVNIWVYYGYDLAETGGTEDVPGTWSNGFLAVAHLGDLSESVNGGTFTQLGASTPSTGGLGGSYVFAGSPDGWHLTGQPAITAASLFTIQHGARSTAAGGYVGQVGKSSGSVLAAASKLSTQHQNRVVWDSSAGVTTSSSTADIYTDSTWQFFTQTWDGTDIDHYDASGLLDQAVTPSARTLDGAGGSSTVSIGHSNTFSEFTGDIDEFRFANVVRTDEWIEVDARGYAGTFWSAPTLTQNERFYARVVGWGDSWLSSPTLKWCGFNWPTGAICTPHGTSGWKVYQYIHGDSAFPTTPSFMDEIALHPGSEYIPLDTTHIIIQSSTNDWAGAWPKPGEPVCDLGSPCDAADEMQFYFANPIIAAVDATIAAGITPVLWTPSPVCPLASPDADACTTPHDPNNRGAGFLAAIASIASTYDLEVIDAYGIGVDLMDRGLFDAYYQDDGHPESADQDEGYRIFAKAAWEAVSRTATPIKWWQGLPRDGLVYRLEADYAVNYAGQYTDHPKTSGYWRDTQHNFTGTTASGAEHWRYSEEASYDIDSSRTFARFAASGTELYNNITANYTTGVLPIGTADRTIVYVFRQPTTPSAAVGHGFNYGDDAANAYIQLGTRNGECAWQSGTAVGQFHQAPAEAVNCNDGEWHILSLTIGSSGTEYVLYDGTTQIDSGTITAVATTEAAAFVRFPVADPGIGTYQDSDVFAAYIYDKVMSSTDRSRLVSYINAELGL